MRRHHVLAIVQAGGEGSRMDVLTRERAKPALPFGGVYQLVDFPMSSLRHSRIEDVWLSVQYQADSLDEQVANGRPWDLDRDSGGFRLLMPQQGGSPDVEGFASGNADELFRIRDQIASAGPQITMVLSSDHVYRFDFNRAIETHVDKSAECTVVTSDVSRDEATHHAAVVTNRLGRVTSFAYKPARPATGTVATEIFLYDTDILLEMLDTLQRELTGQAAPESNGLGDFGDHLLPRLVDRGRTYAHRMPGYWQDLGRPETYFAAHQDLIRGETDLFDDPSWPILARLPQRSPAMVGSGSRVEDALVSPGCRVFGNVRRSVLGPGVTVQYGADVTDSVVFADTTVEADATVTWSILDRGVVVGAGATVGGPPSATPATSDALTLVGRDSQIGAGVVVPGGSRLEPGTTA
jgi:glucose-1-phosphate adenylyltransferase